MARKKTGRPSGGANRRVASEDVRATQVTITIPHALLREIDEYAKALNLKRSAVITLAGKAMMTQAGRWPKKPCTS